MIKAQISKSMVENLQFDSQSKELSIKMETVPAGQALTTPTAMFIFQRSDINSAVYHLIKSLQEPFAAGAISSLFVEESVLESFITKVIPLLPSYDAGITQHGGYRQALSSISRLNAKHFGETTNNSALIVCDFTHEHLTTGASGIVTLHVFRTVKEAVALYAKETLKFGNVTIWNQDHSTAYELIGAVLCPNFYINCNNVPLEPIQNYVDTGVNYAILTPKYHYETISSDNIQKTIIFPVGSTIEK